MESTKRQDAVIQIKKAFVIGLRTLAVCLLFAVCMAVGLALSGLDRVAKQGDTAQTSSQTPLETVPPAQGSSPAPPRAPAAPSSLFIPFLVFSVCVGSVVSYLIL
jgi:hypothetical protein